ncbi:3'-5' exonuclease, partial [Planctomycetota bacterium]
LADLVLFIEANIINHETYSIDLNISENAVTVQTIHGAKGLEYPVVIMANMNRGRFPGGGRHHTDLFYHPLTGLRMSREYGHKNGYAFVFNTWQSDLLTSRLFTDYDEERRLLYVAITRAQQYLLFTCRKPSLFFDSLRGDEFRLEDQAPAAAAAVPNTVDTAPTVIGIEPYDPAPASLAVHDLMEYQAPPQGGGGQGREFGNRVHHFAHRLTLGLKPDWDAPEAMRIEALIGKLKQEGAVLRPELECSLPLEGYLIRGIIDLVAEFDDRIVIIDYKSDATDAQEGEYRKQLSVYYHAAAGFYPGRTITAQLFYVGRDIIKSIEPLPLAELRTLTTAAAESIPESLPLAPDEAPLAEL